MPTHGQPALGALYRRALLKTQDKEKAGLINPAYFPMWI
jgi:hypothetical protein